MAVWPIQIKLLVLSANPAMFYRMEFARSFKTVFQFQMQGLAELVPRDIIQTRQGFVLKFLCQLQTVKFTVQIAHADNATLDSH